MKENNANKKGVRMQKKWFSRIGTRLLLAVWLLSMTAALQSMAGQDIIFSLAEGSYTVKEGSVGIGISGGYVYYGKQAGDWVAFSLPSMPAGEYEASVKMKYHEKKGKFQTYLDGEPVGAVIDQYGQNKEDVIMDLDKVFVKGTGGHEVRFEVQPNDRGEYQLALKEFILKPVKQEGELPIPEDIEFGKTVVSVSGHVVVHPMPFVYEASDDFTVKADGVDVPVTKYTGWYDYAQFSMKGADAGGGAVTVELTYKEPITQYSISPQKLGLTGTVDSKKLTVTLERDEYLIIQINNSEKRLVLMADPEETGVPASQGEGIFNVYMDYGADRTGTNLATKRIQEAIDDASAYGTANDRRGVVYIPKGVYQISTLALKSNVEMYLEGGAALRLMLDKDQYVKRGNKDSIGKSVVHMIHTYNNVLDDPYDDDYQNPENFVESENMKIYGRGTIDGRGEEVDRLGWLSETLVPQNCQDFVSDGITYRESGVWSVNVMLSNDLEFVNFKVLNKLIHENDCIDVNGSQNVLVSNSIGIALDDPYSTKTWETGELFRSACGEGENLENVRFEDCISWTCCYGFKTGQGSWYDHANVVFADSTVYDCSVGLGVHHRYGDAVLKNITFENIDIERVGNSNGPLRNWLSFECDTGSREGTYPVDTVTVKDIRVYDIGTKPSRIRGFGSDDLIHNVSFENVYMNHLGRGAADLTDLNIGEEFYFYADGITVDGKAVPPAPAPISCGLVGLLDQADLAQGMGKPDVEGGYVYAGEKPGDWISFPVSVAEAGKYRLEVELKQHSSKGIFQLYVNDEAVGEPYDQYANGNKEGVVAQFGEVTFERAGVQNIKFEIVGKNPLSDKYQLALKAVRLTFLEPVEPVITGIHVDRLPDQTVYEIGGEFNPAGMVVTASYSNATRKEIDDYEISGFSSEEEGPCRVTVSAYAKTGAGSEEPQEAAYTDTFTVQIVAAPVYVTGIRVQKKPDKTVYMQGEEFDPAGMVVVASYSNATKLPIGGYGVEGYDPQEVGVQELTVSYEAEGESGGRESFTDSFTVTVKEKVYITEIYIKELPAKTKYQFGEPLQTDGMVVIASYSNAQKKKVTDYEVHGYDARTPGEQELKVSCTGEGQDGEETFTAYFTVEVGERKDSNDNGSSSSGESVRSRDSSFWEGGANGWRLKKADGSYVSNAWYQKDGKWYHFGQDGYMQTGWLLDQGIWYYLNPDGAMGASQWIFSGNQWYYLGGNGAMGADQWLKYGDDWYYLGSDGRMMANGWLSGGDGTYYLMPDGTMARKRYIYVDGMWYYADENGRVAR